MSQPPPAPEATQNTDEEVRTLFQKFWDGTRKVICNPTVMTRVRQKQAPLLHTVLCAYARQHEDPEYPLPAEVREAVLELTEEQLEDVKTLGKLRTSLLEIAQRVEHEYQTLEDREKQILLKHLALPFDGANDFMKNMPIWQQIFLSVSIGGTSSWDLYNGIEGFDSSLLPRAVTFAQDNFVIMVGLLLNPSRNWKQFWRAVILDRAVLALPSRAVFLAGIYHPEFVADRTSYIGAVSGAGIVWLFSFILPPAAVEWSDQRYMLKAGKERNPLLPPSEEEGEELENLETVTSIDVQALEDRTSINLPDALNGGTVDLAVVEARILETDGLKLKEYRKSLARLIKSDDNPDGPFEVGEGGTEEIEYLTSTTNGASDMLLRAANKYVKEYHPEHGRKVAICSIWEGILAYMLASARNNLGSLGIIIPYAVYCNRIMQKSLSDPTASAAPLARAFVLTGATALYFSTLINGPIIEDPHFFDHPKNVGGVTAALSFIFLTIVQYTPGGLVAIGGGIVEGYRGIRNLPKRLKARKERKALAAAGNSQGAAVVEEEPVPEGATDLQASMTEAAVENPSLLFSFDPVIANMNSLLVQFSNSNNWPQFLEVADQMREFQKKAGILK